MTYTIKSKLSLVDIVILIFIISNVLLYIVLESYVAIPIFAAILLIGCINHFTVDQVHIDKDKITLERKLVRLPLRKKKTYTPSDFRRFEFDANFLYQSVFIKFKRYNTLHINQRKNSDHEVFMAIYEYGVQNGIECQRSSAFDIAFKSAKLQIASEQYEKNRIK